MMNKMITHFFEEIAGNICTTDPAAISIEVDTFPWRKKHWLHFIDFFFPKRLLHISSRLSSSIKKLSYI